MKNYLEGQFAEKVEGFRLPRYNELPDMGLYLEQVTRYINGLICPIGCAEITPSMVSNYVKKSVIPAPQKKQYYCEQIAYLIFLSVAKNVLSMENISLLFEIQRATYSPDIAYNYFCNELENMLMFICGLKPSVDEIGATHSEAKTMMRSVIISASQIIFVNNCFNVVKSIKENEENKQLP